MSVARASSVPAPASVMRLRRALAEALVRSRLDSSGPIVMANAFLGELRDSRVVSALEISSLWREFLRGGRPRGQLLGLYMHFPYCRSRCTYCFTPSRVPPRIDAPARYVEDSLSETGFFAPLLRDQPIHTWTVGGGTPSLLSVSELREWLGPVARACVFARAGLRSVELNPASTTYAKLSLLRSLGFNRVSFGVQSLDQTVLSAVRREYQNRTMVRRCVEWARKAGFTNINADLIFGLAGESAQGFLASFRLLAEMGPSMIVVSPLVLTDAYMRATGITRERHASDLAAALPAVREGLLRAAARAGYRPAQFDEGGSYWVFLARSVTDVQLARWEMLSSDCGPPSRSTLGLGWESRSRLFGRASYLRESGSFAPDSPLYRLIVLSEKEEMAQHILYALDRSSRIDRDDFRRCFGREVRDAFGFELAALETLGVLRGEGASWSFLPRRAEERLLYGLFFLLDTLQRSPFAGADLARSRRTAERDMAGAAADL